METVSPDLGEQAGDSEADACAALIAVVHKGSFQDDRIFYILIRVRFHG